MFAPSGWLVPRDANTDLIAIMQVVPSERDDDWTDDFQEAVARFRSERKKTIFPGAAQTQAAL